MLVRRQKFGRPSNLVRTLVHGFEFRGEAVDRVAVVVSVVVEEHTHLQEMHQSGVVVAPYCFRYEAIAFAPLK